MEWVGGGDSGNDDDSFALGSLVQTVSRARYEVPQSLAESKEVREKPNVVNLSYFMG